MAQAASVSPLSVEAPPQVEASALIVSVLEALGVDCVFGVPGGAIEPLYNAMAASMRRGGLKPVVARHESGAAFMADGYSRETGKLGVCCATSGPGATNLITGVACAYDSGIPMLVITGQPALPVFGRGALQESSCTGVNTLGMFSHCTRYNTLVSHPDQLETKLIQAVFRAHQHPRGPVHLSIPLDIMRSRVETKMTPEMVRSLLRPSSLVDDDAVSALAAMVRSAGRIAVIVGSGCHRATAQVASLIDQLGAVFVSSPDAKGLVDASLPAYRGVFGFGGHKSARDALANEADLIIAVGASLREWTSGAWNTSVLSDKLVHIDESGENLRYSAMAALRVQGSIPATLERLIQLPLGREGAPRPAPGAVELADPLKLRAMQSPIKPQRLMAELTARMPASTRFVADAGNSMTWAIHYLELQNEGGRRSLRLVSDAGAQVEDEPPATASPGSLSVLMDFAPMGWAIGAAVGIARGNPSNPVVCITGDGSYLMNGQEISTAEQEGLNVVFVVLNDAALGMVKHGQRLAGAERVAFELPHIDFAMQANAMGIPAHIISSPADFDRIDLDALLQRGGPSLLDVRIDAEEVPPMSLRMQTLEGSK